MEERELFKKMMLKKFESDRPQQVVKKNVQLRTPKEEQAIRKAGLNWLRFVLHDPSNPKVLKGLVYKERYPYK